VASVSLVGFATKEFVNQVRPGVHEIEEEEKRL